MKEKKEYQNENLIAAEVEAETVCYTEHYCRNCRYFDSNYHNGYCDNHKQDVNAFDPGCSQWWWNGN